MAVGKKTGGRKKGTPNKANKQRQQQVAASGLTPLDYMLQVMRDEKATRDERMDAAKSAAPYVHPRLATTSHTGPNGGPINLNLTGMTDEQLKALEPVLALLAGAAGGSSSPG